MDGRLFHSLRFAVFCPIPVFPLSGASGLRNISAVANRRRRMNVMMDMKSKATVRRQLKEVLAGMSEADRHRKSIAACGLLASTPEFEAARVVMLYLSTPYE